MRIVHYYALFGKERSGVTDAITRWATAQRVEGHAVEIWHAGPTRADVDVKQVVLRHLGRTRRSFVPVGLPTGRAGQLTYLHEAWTQSNLVVGAILRARRRDYVLMPHGAYEPSIVENLSRPRRVRGSLESRLISGAAAVHVYFATEQILVERIGQPRAWIVSPTPVAAKAASWIGDGDYIAWFGRIDPHHKGLDLLLRGLAKVPVDRRPTLRLHGYDYRDGVASLERLVDHLQLGDSVIFGGEVRGEEKIELLRHARAYVHPSRWESHSIALLETLALGVPVLLSASIHAAAPLASAGAVIAVPATTAGWAQALSDLGAVDGAILGAQGRVVAAELFGHSSVMPAYWLQLMAASGMRN